MRKVVLVMLGLGLLIFLLPGRGTELISPFLAGPEKPKPLLKYSFENLRQREYAGSEIKLEKIIKKEATYTSWLFSYQTDGRKITGMANLPQKPGKLPVIVMLRGYADDDIYFTGLGTRNVAAKFAEAGFITLAPDFLGFGGSDSSFKDILEARFYRPVEILNLLASVKGLPQANPQRVGLWAHSNGGQIAISVLEINRQPIPTVLWAPVTAGFPEAILNYLSDPPAGGDDQGLKVKKAIDEFTKSYDVKNYSITNYFSDINAPLQIHQGLADPLVKGEWATAFVDVLTAAGKNVTYYQYSRNDHNLKQSWDVVVSRDVAFFQKNLL